MNLRNLPAAILFIAVTGIGPVCFQLKGQADPLPTSSIATNAVASLANEVMLTRRVDNGPYGASAYSFRLASQALAVHHNHVDLVFNGFGKLYINPNGGMHSRIVDLGPVSFDAPATTPSPDAPWQPDFITPQTGHVYYQAIRDDRQSFAVLFQITAATPDLVKLRWKPVAPQHQVLPLAPGSDAGTMGIDGNGGAGGNGGDGEAGGGNGSNGGIGT